MRHICIHIILLVSQFPPICKPLQYHILRHSAEHSDDVHPLTLHFLGTLSKNNILFYSLSFLPILSKKLKTQPTSNFPPKVKQIVAPKAVFIFFPVHPVIILFPTFFFCTPLKSILFLKSFLFPSYDLSSRFFFFLFHSYFIPHQRSNVLSWLHIIDPFLSLYIFFFSSLLEFSFFLSRTLIPLDFYICSCTII